MLAWVADTDHNDFHLAEVGRAHNGVFAAFKHFAVERGAVVVGVAAAYEFIASCLDFYKLLQVYFDVVGFGPDDFLAVGRSAPRGQGQGYFVFVVVVGVVATKSHEEREVAVVKAVDFIFLFCVDKHL